MHGVWTIVVAGGSGTRFGGDRPKQYLPLGDRRVLDHTLAAARDASDGVVLVVGATFAADAEPGADLVVPGGATRSGSVRAGLAAVPADAEIVVVHDAARPLAPPEVFKAVIDAVRSGADAAIPGVPVTDTVKRVDAAGVVVETPDRDTLVAVQTPQAFSAAVLRRAHEGEPEATDDAALVEAAGGTVVVVPGHALSRKVTTPEDLAALERALDG